MIVVDVETTGLNPATDRLTQVAGVKVNHWFEAVAVFFDDRPRMADAFVKWAKKCDGQNGKIFLAGENPWFDCAFLRKAISPKVSWPFHYRLLDLHSIAFPLYRGEHLGLDDLIRRYGLTPRPENPFEHNALQDALIEARLFGRIMASLESRS